MKNVGVVAHIGKSSLTFDLAKALLEEQAKSNRIVDIEIQELKTELQTREEVLKMRSDQDERTLEMFNFNVRGMREECKELQEKLHIKEIERGREGVFSIDAIRKIAIKYNLRFLPSGLYRGFVPPELATRLKEVSSKHRFYDTSGYNKDNNSCMILAPAESFALSPRPIDPICFGRLDDNNFILIHKWGNDLSVFRKITQFHMRSRWTFFLTILVPFLLGLILWWAYGTGALYDNYPVISWVSGVFAGIASLIWFIMAIENSGSDNSNGFGCAKDVWNSPFNN